MFDSYNLLEIRELYGLSQTDLAKRLAITREVVNKMEKGKMKVSKRTAARLQTFLQEHPYGFYSGDVNILGKSSQTSEKKRSTLPFQKQLLEEKNTSTPFWVPLVGIKAQAGYVKGFEEVDYIDTLEQYSLLPGVNPIGAVWRYFEVDGDSMEPTFGSGDIVLATMVPHEDWNDIKNFSVYVILTADQLLIKRLYRKSETEWVLISDNEDVAPQLVLPVEKVKQLWLFRRQIRSRAPQPKEVKITA
ncbi:LexA family transcriptional regulator [Flavisolibacter nicotianae]|uniref:LexA family transcriptional regulator n=1 Tax=Flavisolibacter nicotianae TaxID=2364882 RepID=UPI000EB5ADA8|nr:LexA family transcriptional regulator [Flavisolibacter nicotianae]